MIPWALVFKNIRYIAFGLAVLTAIWFYRDWREAKKENARLSANAESERKKTTTGFSEVTLTKKELKQELEHNNQPLLEQLADLKIKLRRIEQLQSIQNTYRDTTERTYILSTILRAIEDKKPAQVPVIDSTECHLIKGYIHFDGQDLELKITDRKFASITDIVAHTEKVGLRFWKWFRKKKITVSVLNSCGKTETRIIKVTK